MLPTPADFDAHLERDPDVGERLKRIRAADDELAELKLRCARARALAILELYEQAGRTNAVMRATGLSRGRVSQLLADARLWRQHDAIEEAGHG